MLKYDVRTSFPERNEVAEANTARQLREQSRELLQEAKDTEIAYQNQIEELQAALKVLINKLLELATFYKICLDLY